MKEKITVIVTNYNHSKYIEGAIKSINEQTYSNIEVIIIDDGSTDNSREIIVDLRNKYKRNPIKTIFLDENKGKWNALNIAISQATGELITLQDADDACVPKRIELQHQVLKESNSLHNLCGFVHCYSEEDIQKHLNYSLPQSIETIDHASVTKNVYIGLNTPGINHYFVDPKYEVHGASCLFYKKLWDFGMKFLPGNMGLRCQKAEDSDFNTKVTLLMQKTSVIKQPLYLYRRNTSTNNAWLEGL